MVKGKGRKYTFWLEEAQCNQGCEDLHCQHGGNNILLNELDLVSNDEEL